MEAPNAYKYLERAKCYEAAGVDDKRYFQEIKKSMKNIGFTDEEMNKMWALLCAVLELGNIEYDDKEHQDDESKPCKIINKNLMVKIASRIGVNEENL